MDACRPNPNSEAGDADLSLMSYLDCCDRAYREYEKRVEGVNYRDTFQYLAFHTPFGGMIKGAHRTMMRRMVKAKPQEIEEDFHKRVMPGLIYCQRVGNVMGATVLLSLASTIDNADLESPKRIGCYSYGSGCCSEFYSGVATPSGQEKQRRFKMQEHLNSRYQLDMDEYLLLLKQGEAVKFGTRNIKVDSSTYQKAIDRAGGRELLILDRINEFHREYRWI
jgi:polyketide biosynthesis 3-hydroxy-3-methylglutaryl-CoA synthase-like enzyme PksG